MEKPTHEIPEFAEKLPLPDGEDFTLAFWVGARCREGWLLSKQNYTVINGGMIQGNAGSTEEQVQQFFDTMVLPAFHGSMLRMIQADVKNGGYLRLLPPPVEPECKESYWPWEIPLVHGSVDVHDSVNDTLEDCHEQDSYNED